jgi:transcriptional regulator with GAF, ATPase, and Fis domain
MATQLSWRKSRFDSDSFTAPESSALETDELAAFRRELAALGAQLQDKSRDREAFLGQVAKDAQHFTAADSAVVALGQPGKIVCRARTGSIGPALGAPLDTRSGISGESLRQRSALRCEDSETDPRVDPELCRLLGVRSLAVVPVFANATAVGVLEVFSSRPNAFQDHHVLVLEQLAKLIAGVPTDSGGSIHPSSPVLPQNKQESSRFADSVGDERRPGRWVEAFQLRPYQVAIMAGFLLLDLAAIYWQLR